MYTSKSAFGEAAMSRLVRQPEVALLATDAAIHQELTVRPLLVALHSHVQTKFLGDLAHVYDYK